MLDTQSMFDKAAAILRKNDRGRYTVPTEGLYPFQWNWDSCLTALGFAHIDEPRAWTEIETLFNHQWPDGMVPHIIFHQEDDGYFPGPAVWATGRPVPTSGITQPPVAGFAVRRLVDRAANRGQALARAEPLVKMIDRWHQWFFDNRDPAGEGLVAIIHPWESGRDNAIDWDQALARVPTDGVAAFTRRDTQHADADHRPTDDQYRRYIWLVEHFRRQGWDNSKLHDSSPFRVVDPGFNAILIRSCLDIAEIASELGLERVARRNRDRAGRALDALQSLWSAQHGQYLCHDRAAQGPIESLSVGGLLPAFAPIPGERAQKIAQRIGQLGTSARFLVPSHDPADPRFDAKRYWRGPAWLIVNYMIADGLALAGETDMARKIQKTSLELISEQGFAEYYDPITGEPCGGGEFTWTAAMVIEFLRQPKNS